MPTTWRGTPEQMLAVIRMRCKPSTLAETAQAFGITKERVRQIENQRHAELMEYFREVMTEDEAKEAAWLALRSL